MNLRDRPNNTVIAGLLLIASRSIVIALILALGLAIPLANAISAIALSFFSLTQLFYVVPICRQLRRENLTETMKGVIIGAIITVLLNGGCFIFLLQSLSYS